MYLSGSLELDVHEFACIVARWQLKKLNFFSFQIQDDNLQCYSSAVDVSTEINLSVAFAKNLKFLLARADELVAVQACWKWSFFLELTCSALGRISSELSVTFAYFSLPNSDLLAMGTRDKRATNCERLAHLLLLRPLAFCTSHCGSDSCLLNSNLNLKLMLFPCDWCFCWSSDIGFK